MATHTLSTRNPPYRVSAPAGAGSCWLMSHSSTTLPRTPVAPTSRSAMLRRKSKPPSRYAGTNGMPGPAKISRFTSPSARHPRDQPADRAPARNPRISPPTAQAPTIAPVPLQLNCGSSAINRIHPRAATPQQIPSPRPTPAVCGILTTSPADKPAADRRRRSQRHTARRAGARRTTVPPPHDRSRGRATAPCCGRETSPSLRRRERGRRDSRCRAAGCGGRRSRPRQ